MRGVRSLQTAGRALMDRETTEAHRVSGGSVSHHSRARKEQP